MKYSVFVKCVMWFINYRLHGGSRRFGDYLELLKVDKVIRR